MDRAIDTSVAVVIVGAGPTGLTAANLLGQAGITTLLLERQAQLSEYPKAITIDDEGLRICQAVGLLDEVCAHILPAVDAHYISNGRYFARVSPSSYHNGHPLISTFHQPTFEGILLQGVQRFPCVDILFQHTLEDFEQDEQGVSITVRTPQGTLRHIACAYLLACDGGKSSIRHMLNIPLQPPLTRFLPLRRTGRRASSSERWVVIDCVEQVDRQEEPIIFFCNPARPAVTVPAPNGGRRWEFMLLPGDREEDLLRPTTIAALIQQTRATQPEASTTTTSQIIRQAIYTFHAAIATRFSQGRVFLLGDAAHLMPPFGGQGMNSGMRDAQNLCWKLAMVVQEQASPELLETYHQERHPHAEQMVLFSSILGLLIMPIQRPIALLRDLFFRGIVQHIPPLREAVESMRVKPQPGYTNGFLLPRTQRKNDRYRGLLLPQPTIMHNGKQMLLDEVLDNSFSLIRLYATQTEQSRHAVDEAWQALGVRCVDVEAKRMQPFFKKQLPSYILVRPDKYIMGAFTEAEVKRITKDMQALLQREMINISAKS
ncbi:3-(3-hydroxy-phenyl)propionate/3-hydroxycinnamic acid hydroxylase [Reticulibacter mediterranei]|uniref:3-(3-hydroxy-phenyl)propionate/3-hydroxycinnamic acid hydroxylase n=1 Tax=Reticulibacter mediterranei TaxID=2778369 RepID=A0A8J3N544_9CHLR|nr:bifunctional 3-(3-hydroxy-phenyl)propionate/3-hydroxycinnamic acid hydroxylase [Reticulibacter mediterranei]GHO94772.1 3-(3-hydroxy-phenyl)propionate/3-hydroxycinnamic acid hydroxylase [Reticulibacter mediterranei]